MTSRPSLATCRETQPSTRLEQSTGRTPPAARCATLGRGRARRRLPPSTRGGAPGGQLHVRQTIERQTIERQTIERQTIEQPDESALELARSKSPSQSCQSTSVAQPRCARRQVVPGSPLKCGGNGTHPDRWQQF
jgi:hypothetical protein